MHRDATVSKHHRLLALQNQMQGMYGRMQNQHFEYAYLLNHELLFYCLSCGQAEGLDLGMQNL